MTDETQAAIESNILENDERMTFSIAGETNSSQVHWYAEKLHDTLIAQGHTYRPMAAPRVIDTNGDDETADTIGQVRMVINLVDLDRPWPVRRTGQGTFVVTIVKGRDNETDALKAGFPVLLRALSNMVILNTEVDGALESHFITIEQGHYLVRHSGDDADFFAKIVQRLRPLACSHLVINNEFVADLPDQLWNGDETTRQIGWAGQQLDKLGLLPNVVPLDQFLTERDLRHVKRLYQMGGLSYCNLSARATHDPHSFWMSASGVDKSKLETVGRDILLVTGYEPKRFQMRLSVPPRIEPRRVSVDAIEHWMIYREHPQVGAIIHIHAWWRDPIPSTQVNYPCGTYELATEVATLVRQAPDPSHAVIGLKNHGLTITGPSIQEIFERINGMIVPQVPMS